jgi:hypothetical protein
MYMRFGFWNVRSLYKAGSLLTVSRELARYTSKLDLVGVQEVRWEGCGTEPAGEYTFERLSYITLRGHCCHSIVLAVHAPTEDKTDYVKDSFAAMHKLINSIWNKVELLDQWKEPIIVPLNKNGDKTDCNSYRGISLL